MKYGKLRITWSVAWGVLAVLLCVLWIQNQRRGDHWHYNGPRGFKGLTISRGTVTFATSPEEAPDARYSFGWVHEREQLTFVLVEYGWDSTVSYYRAPIWPFPISLACIAAMPWIRHLTLRFSLRTLLIATTLVAVALGLIVWLSRAR